MTKAKRGLVFGKFLPFHKGHRAMIDFAAAQCEELIVLVCGNETELIPLETRVEAVRQTFAKKRHRSIIVQAFYYDTTEIPKTMEYSRIVSELWASKFRAVLPYLDVLITSEKYGDYMAEYLNIKHIFFDKHRNKHQISSAMIRDNPFKYWDFIIDAAKPFFQKKVILLGTECTGKMTLSKTLGQYFQATVATSESKNLVNLSKTFTKNEVETALLAHEKGLEAAKTGYTPLIIADTDVYTAQAYAKYALGEYLPLDAATYQRNRADLYLYLNNDVPFATQNENLSESARNDFDKVLRTTLQDFGVEFHEIKGRWGERFNAARKLVEQHLLE